MNKTKDSIVKLLKQKQDLETEIQNLEKLRQSLDFVVEYDKKIASAEAAKQEIRTRYKALLKDHNTTLSQMDLMLEVDKFSPKIGHVSRSIVGGEGIANLVTTDWHYEEEVRPAEVQGLNSYNPKIARARVSKMWDVFLRLVEIERYGTEIQKAVINILGDLFSGYIKEDLKTTNLLTPAEALLEVEDILYAGLMYLYEKGGFSQIEVVCHCGNHTRYTDGKAIHYKGQNKKTFEWVLYHQLARMIDRAGKSDKIKFIIPESAVFTNRQFGYPIRTSHGNSFTYRGGIGGESIPVNKRILRWNMKNRAYLDVFGHLHSRSPARNYIGVGSLIGYNQLALMRGYEYEPPTQEFFLIERKRGLVADRPIYL